MKFKSLNKVGGGALILLISGVICKCLGAFFRLPLTNMLGIEGIGVFQLVMSLYAFALVVTSGGVSSSLSKLISSARASERTEKVRIYLKQALLISVGIGLGLGVLFLIFGKYIAIFQNIENPSSYYLFALMLPLGAGLATLRGYFQGYENMLPTALSQIIEQVVKFAFGLLFAYYFSKFGMVQGVFGAFLGVTLSELVSLIFLFIYYEVKKHGKKEIYSKEFFKSTRKEFNSANFPLTLSASILPLVNAFEGLVIIPRLVRSGLTSSFATELFGLQAGVVGAILNFPLIISIAVTTALLPNISYHISKGSGGKVIIEKGLKTLLYLILPTTFGMVAISKEVLDLVYNDMTPLLISIAFNLMFYGGFSIVFTALMQYIIMLLQANGQFNFILLITIIGGAIKATLSFTLSAIPSINIYAILLGNIAMTTLVCLLGLVKLKKLVSFSLPISQVAVLFFGTALMYLAVYTFVNSSYFSPIVNILLGVVLGVVVYVVLTISFLLKIFTRKKVKNTV